MPTFREDLHLGHAVPTVDTDDITAKAITEDKMADDSISTRCLQDGSVTEPKLADDAVSTRTIQDGAVTAEKLADGSVGLNKISDEVYKAFESIEAGGIMLAQDFGERGGGSDVLGISQKKLTEEHYRVDDELQGINKALGEDDDKGTVRGRLTDLEDVIGDDDIEGSIKERLGTVEENIEAGGPIDTRLRSNASAIEEETDERTYGDENLLALINAGIRDGEGLEFDIEPTRASANPVTSGGIWTAIERLPRLTNSENTDLNISDENGNVIMEMQGGQVRTKEFDSRDVYNFSEGNTKADFTVEDPNGNILAEFNMGHIRTRDFDSRELSNIKVDSSKVDFSIKDNSGNSIVEFYNGHIRTQCFDSADSRTITILDNILFIN